jgi:hypothetical protein
MDDKKIALPFRRGARERSLEQAKARWREDTAFEKGRHAKQEAGQIQR